MKREEFMRRLRRHGCYIKREGGSHTIVYNIKSGASETVPRHNEIDNILVKKICKRLDIKTL